MTETEHAAAEAAAEEERGGEEQADEPMRALLKRALATEAIAKDTPDILRGVQRRIRKRSRGKFFNDGWSTAQARAGYMLVALVTLLLVVVAYYGMAPTGLR